MENLSPVVKPWEKNFMNKQDVARYRIEIARIPAI